MSFEAVNKELVNNKEFIELLDYVKKCNFNNIDLSFIDKFIELVPRNDFCIPHVYLKEYGVYKLTGGSSELDKKLESNGFKIDVDFRLRKVSESAPSGGSTHFNEYMLTPDTFKTLLIRSTKCKIYANYYIYLEKCIKYYNDYQNDLKERYIITLRDKIQDKDDIIYQLRNEMKLQHEESQKKLDIQHEENKASFTIINHKFDNLSDVLLERTEELEISKSETKLSSNDRINIPTSNCNIEHMVVLRSNIDSLYKYRMIRGTYSYVKAKIGSLAGIYFKRLSKNNTNPWLIDESIKAKREYDLVKIYTDIPNARHLFRAVKDKNIIIFSGVNFNILISEEDVFIKFQEAFDSRLTIEIEEKEILAAKTKALTLHRQLDLLKIRP